LKKWIYSKFNYIRKYFSTYGHKNTTIYEKQFDFKPSLKRDFLVRAMFINTNGSFLESSQVLVCGHSLAIGHSLMRFNSKRRINTGARNRATCALATGSSASTSVWKSIPGLRWERVRLFRSGEQDRRCLTARCHLLLFIDIESSSRLIYKRDGLDYIAYASC
jgi:hypothetical protein